MNRREWLSIIGGGITASTAGCSSNADGGEDENNEGATNPASERNTSDSDSSANEGSPNLEWDAIAGAKIGDGYNFPAPLLLDGTLVVVAGLNDAGIVEGYNPKTGDMEWEISTQTSMNSHHSLPSDGSVVIVPTDSGISAISGSGEVVWSDDIRPSGDMFSAGGMFYIPKYSGVEARSFDGSQEWTWDTDGSVSHIGGTENTIYTKSGTSLYAINADDGTTLWESRTTVEPSVPPVAKEGLLFIGHDDGQLSAINTESQEEEWSINLESRVAVPITKGESNIYAAGWSYPLHALDQKTGSESWTFDPQYQTVSSAIEVDDSVYVSSDTGTLFARNGDDGSPIWSYELGSASRSPPLVQDSSIFITSEDGGIYRLSLPN